MSKGQDPTGLCSTQTQNEEVTIEKSCRVALKWEVLITNKLKMKR